MVNQIESMKQALEALESIRPQNMTPLIHPAKTTLRTAIEDYEKIGDAYEKGWLECQAAWKLLLDKQEPVAWIDPKHLEWLAQSHDNLTGAGLAARQRSADRVPLYTHPAPAAQREWIGLTSDDVERLVKQARQVPADVPCPDYNERLLALADAKLRENNMP